MRAINATTMRHMNRTLVLDHIRSRPISRAELAEETGLTRASITQIVEELITEGLVLEGSMIGRTRLGRRSTQLTINPDAGAFFGVNLDKDQCTVGMVDLSGRVIRQNTELVAGRTPEEVVNAIAAIVKMQMHCSGIDISRIYGMGMCAPGPVDSAAGRLLNPRGLEAWKDIPIADMIGARTNIPVSIETAAGAQALEEKYFGRAGDTFLLVCAAETLSIAAVVNGRLYHGRRDFPAELGDCPADMSGSRILNDTHSAAAMMKTADCRAQEEADDRCSSGGDCDGLINHIGMGVISAMHAFGIDSVVLTGVMGRSAPLRRRLNAAIRAAVKYDVGNGPICAGIESNPVRAAASPAYHALFHSELSVL